MLEMDGYSSPESSEKPIIGKEIVAFIGLEGSGKSTVAKKLAEVAGKPRISTGDIFRKLAAEDTTEIGDECRRVMETHAYVDPDMFLRILGAGMQDAALSDGFILDGGFRTDKETVEFWDMLKAVDREMPVTIIQLRVPVWQAADRLVNGIKRFDDNIDAVVERMGHYYEDVGKRINFLKEQPECRLIRVDARGSMEETLSKVVEALV